MSFKDHFSGHASEYARYRPGYPAELYAWLVEYTASSRGVPARKLTVWDVATGSGQAAVALADCVAKVVATDASATQLSHATPHERVEYLVAPAETPPMSDASVDLVTVAQALHWFDLERFLSAVRRVGRAGAICAAWTYELFTIEPAVDSLVQSLYEGPVGDFWPPERRHIEARYTTLPLGLEAVDVPEFEMVSEWALDQVLGYLRTWSAVRRYMREAGDDPVSALEAELRDAWGSAPTRTVRWPFVLKVGRIPS